MRAAQAGFRVSAKQLLQAAHRAMAAVLTRLVAAVMHDRFDGAEDVPDVNRLIRLGAFDKAEFTASLSSDQQPIGSEVRASQGASTRNLG